MNRRAVDCLASVRTTGLALARPAFLLVCLSCALAACGSPAAEPRSDAPPARFGGRLVVALGGEPTTFNPVLAADAISLNVLQTLHADLIHIDRQTQATVPSLAERWSVSEDGRTYRLVLRPGLRFSDGHPASADDVVFSFRLYLDDKLGSPQRDLLLVGGEPIEVRKIDERTVEVELSQPYAVAERLFDSFAILPRHRLAEPHASGKLGEMWGIDAPAASLVGLGPFRVKERRPGERLVLERNPFYWKKDASGRALPYLDELVYLVVPSKDAQLARFQAGELDAVDRLSGESFDLLAREARRRGHRLYDAGPGLDFSFLFFNLNELEGPRLAPYRRRQAWFRQAAFRRAVSAAIDREAIVRLVYRGRATGLSSHVTPGMRRWVHASLPPPRRSLEEGRRLLEQAGFTWAPGPDGALRDPEGRPVELSILTVASSAERGRMATLIQEDLRQIGIRVSIAALEMQAVLGRLFENFEYDACILALDGGDADPNPSMGILLSGGSHHLWSLKPAGSVPPWQAEIDDLMRRQLAERDPRARKRLYDRVQEIVVEQRPFISLVTPNILLAAREGLANLRPAVLEDHLLWNVEEIHWRGPR